MQVTLQRSAPALFLFSPQNRKFAAATFGAGTTFTYIAPSGMFGSGAASRPARPGRGDLVVRNRVWTDEPAVPAGRVFNGAAPLNRHNNGHHRGTRGACIVRRAVRGGTGADQHSDPKWRRRWRSAAGCKRRRPEGAGQRFRLCTALSGSQRRRGKSGATAMAPRV